MNPQDLFGGICIGALGMLYYLDFMSWIKARRERRAAKERAASAAAQIRTYHTFLPAGTWRLVKSDHPHTGEGR